MGELDCDAAEIVPHPSQDDLDLGVGFFGKGSVQIGATDAVLLEQRTDFAHQPAGEIDRAPAIHPLDRAQHADRKRTDDCIDQCLDAAALHAHDPGEACSGLRLSGVDAGDPKNILDLCRGRF